MKRRGFLSGTLSVVSVVGCGGQSTTATAQNAVSQTPSEPLVWPVVAKLPPGIRAFAGHTDTVPDIVGRIGTPPSLVIFTEGNHLMVLLSDDIVGAFPSWAKSQPQYADLDLDNILVVTVPQPIVVQMIRTGGIALGNLTLDVSRKSGFYPDIVMGGTRTLARVAQARSDRAGGALLLEESRLRVARPQRQSPWNSSPYRYSTYRRADRPARRSRSGGSRQVPRCYRRVDRKVRSRRRVRNGSTELSRSHRNCAS